MTGKFKTFKDLVFEPHPSAINAMRLYPRQHDRDPYTQAMCEAAQAHMDFPNGYGISVLFGVQFYSNGRDTYEVSVSYKGSLVCYFPEDSVRGWQTKEEVTKLMIEIQKEKE